jgi:hypothetical protein
MDNVVVGINNVIGGIKIAGDRPIPGGTQVQLRVLESSQSVHRFAKALGLRVRLTRPFGGFARSTRRWPARRHNRLRFAL